MNPREILKRLTGKTYIYLVNRGNTAIKLALKIADKQETLIQDQGGWITYKQYPKKITEIETCYGIVNHNDLEKKASKDSCFLVNSMPGYLALEDMETVSKICKDKKCFLINDISGSISTENARFGDIILGSFGRWKPLWLEHGAFLASNKKLEIEENFDKTRLKELENLLKNLDKRYNSLLSLAEKVKKDLSNLEIIHRDNKGIVVCIKINNEDQKKKVLEYCSSNDYEHKTCPIYIRVLTNAITIELKRIKDLENT
jgi:hypothetical protein